MWDLETLKRINSMTASDFSKWEAEVRKAEQEPAPPVHYGGPLHIKEHTADTVEISAEARARDKRADALEKAIEFCETHLHAALDFIRVTRVAPTPAPAPAPLTRAELKILVDWAVIDDNTGLNSPRGQVLDKLARQLGFRNWLNAFTLLE